MNTKRLSEELDKAWFGRSAAGKIDYAAFDKPGTYRPVAIWSTHGMSGAASLVKGYLRDDEIAEGVADKKIYVEKARANLAKQQAVVAKKSGPEYASWIRDYKTDEGIQAHLEKWDADNDKMAKADSIKDWLAVYPHLAGTKPAEYKSKFMLLDAKEHSLSLQGTLFAKALYRVGVVGEIDRGSPALAIKLSEMGVILEDRTGWAQSADATKKALEYLKRQRESILAAKDQKQIEVNKWAVEQAEIALKQALGKYPTADTTKLPPAQWLTIRNWK